MGVVVITPFIAQAGTLTDLDDWGLLEQATGDPMHVRGRTLWEGDNGSEAGIWECTPGSSHWEEPRPEFVHVLSGRMTVIPDGSDPIEVAAGDTFVVSAGWVGDWIIHETIRKVYVVV